MTTYNIFISFSEKYVTLYDYKLLELVSNILYPVIVHEKTL